MKRVLLVENDIIECQMLFIILDIIGKSLLILYSISHGFKVVFYETILNDAPIKILLE